MVKDPVCRMQLNEQAASEKSEYRRKSFYFSNPACKAKFDGNPEKYATK